MGFTGRFLGCVFCREAFRETEGNYCPFLGLTTLAAIAIPENGVGDFSQQNVIKASKDSHTTTTTGLIESCDREDNVSLLSAIGNKRGFRC